MTLALLSRGVAIGAIVFASGVLGFAHRAQAAVTITGTVVDAKGVAIEYAAVAVPEIRKGAITNAAGVFTIALPAVGRYTVAASHIGYTSSRSVVDVPEGGLAPLRIVLNEAPLPVEAVSVRASSFGTEQGQRQGTVLRRYDIYTTPGAAADLMHSVHTLPGVHAPNEGAALYVRGGAPYETLVRLDGGDVGHPYHYESASGGLFGIIDPSLISSAYFSSGAFAPRYGNALSGVLDVETTNDISSPAVGIGANLVGASGTATYPIVPDRLGIIFTGHATTTDMLFRLYGSARTFVSVPHSEDGGVKLVAHTPSSGTATLMWAASGDHTGVLLDFPTYHGAYDNTERVDIWNAGWKGAIAQKVALTASAARSRFHTDWSFSDFAYAGTEDEWTGRTEAHWPASSAIEVSGGVDGANEISEYDGTVPADSTDYAHGAPTHVLSQSGRRMRLGAYADDKMRVVRDVYATLGGRVDRYGAVRVAGADGPATWTADPRAALAWNPRKPLTLRVAAGGFHESPSLQYTDAHYGNPALAPLAARHVITGVEYKRDAFTARVEGYRKDYSHLVLNDPVTRYSANGDGYASGVDVFTEAHWIRFTGWMSYGYVSSQRHELDATERVPSPYAPTHDLTLVGTYHMNHSWDVGGKMRWASGSRYTPIVGATYDAARDVYHPIDGPLYSETLPAYARLDVRLTKLFEMPPAFGLPGAFGVAYIEGMNVLGIRNVLQYEYSPDYSLRHAVDSYFSRRTFVFGAGLNW